MQTRRSFFKRAVAIVAIVALAPEIAFRAKLSLPKTQDFENIPYWMETSRIQHVYDDKYLKWRELIMAGRTYTPDQIESKFFGGASNG